MYDLLRLLGSQGGIASDFPKCSGGTRVNAWLGHLPAQPRA
jgi:hypothetical protein